MPGALTNLVRLSSVLAIVLVGRPSRADDRPANDEHTAAEVAGAPRPGDESGRVDDQRERDGVLRTVGRGVLFVPRAAYEIAIAPVRGGLWAYERFQLYERWKRLFFTADGRIGVYPTARFSSGYGVTAGGRFVWRDAFGDGEHVSVRAGTGGRYRELIAATIHSGDRFDGVFVALGAEYERRPHDRFFGIGNADELEREQLMGPIDPLREDTAVETRYRQEHTRATLVIDSALWGDLHAVTSGSIAKLSFAPSDKDTPIDAVYLTDQLPGFGGVTLGYGELELAWDTRASYSRWEPTALASTGWRLSAFAGRVTVADGPDFWRLGAETQQLLRIAEGPRMLAARVAVETVTGRRDEVPFDELPKLGGAYVLRGYEIDRFRDRASAVGSLEYRWDLSRFVAATLFVDAGRVYPELEAFTLDGLRVGYGAELELYTDESFVMRGSVASSIDGGVFFNLAFDPAFDVEPRVERK